jgi:hypothetical protein
MKTLKKIDNSIWYSFRSSIWDSIYLLVNNSIEDSALSSIRISLYLGIELTETSIKHSVLNSIRNSINKLND